MFGLYTTDDKRQGINRQRVVHIIFTQKMTGAPNMPSGGQYELSSSNERLHARKAQSARWQRPITGPSGRLRAIQGRVFTEGAQQCQPCHHIFSCLLTYCSAWMLTIGGSPLVCATLGLRNICKTVRKNISCSSLLMPKEVWYKQTYIK